jgi:hypothetical protein
MNPICSAAYVESFQVFWVVVCSQAESDTLDKGRVAIEIAMFKTAM